jgi:hypothetical protein
MTRGFTLYCQSCVGNRVRVAKTLYVSFVAQKVLTIRERRFVLGCLYRLLKLLALDEAL